VTGNRALRNLTDDLTAKLEDVEFLACYSAAIVRVVRQRERWAKWLVAVAACVPFLARLRAISGPTADWLVAIVPLLAIGLPIWNPDKTIEAASTLHGRYLPGTPATSSALAACARLRGSERGDQHLCQRSRARIGDFGAGTRVSKIGGINPAGHPQAKTPVQVFNTSV